VVDDDLDHLRLVEIVLRPLGFLVQAVPDGETALEILGDVVPNIFLLDIDMPGMDGWELAKRIRQNPTHRTTPILMVSGHALEARNPADREGLFDAFGVKPYSVADTLRRLADPLKIELVFSDAEQSDSAAPGAAFSSVDLGQMEELTGIGHAAGLARKLDGLERADAIPKHELDRFRDRLREFDMQGILRLIDEMKRHAA
jgi:CheY-like chemotaxis protein